MPDWARVKGTGLGKCEKLRHETLRMKRRGKAAVAVMMLSSGSSLKGNCLAENGDYWAGNIRL